MISIALCTCNGEAYIGAQLASLARQRVLPVELVVCDDASTDATVSIVQAFMATAPFPVRLQINSSRQGIGSNFGQAISLCSGACIALCDQDDIWAPDKLAHIQTALAHGADWFFCDADVVDEGLQPLGYTLWERVGFSPHKTGLAPQEQLFEALLRRRVVAGATLAFRAALRNRLLPIPSDWQYDGWLSLVLGATSRGHCADTVLQQYRQHAHNALGARRRGLVEESRRAFTLERTDYLRQETAQWLALVARLGDSLDPYRHRLLQGKMAHLKRRSAFPALRLARIPYVLVEIMRGNYTRYSRNWGSIAIDLLLK